MYRVTKDSRVVLIPNGMPVIIRRHECYPIFKNITNGVGIASEYDSCYMLRLGEYRFTLDKSACELVHRNEEIPSAIAQYERDCTAFLKDIRAFEAGGTTQSAPNAYKVGPAYDGLGSSLRFFENGETPQSAPKVEPKGYQPPKGMPLITMGTTASGAPRVVPMPDPDKSRSKLQDADMAKVVVGVAIGAAIVKTLSKEKSESTSEQKVRDTNAAPQSNAARQPDGQSQPVAGTGSSMRVRCTQCGGDGEQRCVWSTSRTIKTLFYGQKETGWKCVNGRIQRTGYLTHDAYRHDGDRCPDCNGRGHKPCAGCGGQGYYYK